ncbi:uncharacterized protein BO80DRAFT_361857 [Aspergillus ibericus CBS 121593]|uniref:Uncharacterized protein n=1 Tax=Aspergillus ibericus CBS 121593 TaxID=1448316 RepID=A0A395GTB5_9EURO|nr:hypothetical protein BO80DRAFT_361857 [Aspergillus ibericus CBS 121593]RAK98424.1 hypothetical protein BO80DRAFT_361857 [Aspergillus ibericus CBS 121593]
MPITLSVLVFRGDPVDAMEYRHAGIYLDYGKDQSSMMHVVGAPGVFRFQEDDKMDYAKSEKLERHILVTTLHKGFTRDMVKAACSRTPVKNDGSEWNCQHWVGDALKELMKLGVQCLTKEQREEALDKMTAAVAEAKDEKHLCVTVSGWT